MVAPHSLARHHWNKTHRNHGALCDSSSFIFIEDDKVLIEGRAPHRRDRSSARLELIDERLRHLRWSGCEDDAIERSGFRPAAVTIAGAHEDGVDANLIRAAIMKEMAHG